MKPDDKQSPVSSTDIGNMILQGEQEFIRTFLDAISEGIIVQAPTGEILICNKAAEAISGLTREQMGDRHYLDNQLKSIHEDGTPYNWDSFPANRVRETGESQKDVILGINYINQPTIWLKINSNPVFDLESNELALIVTSFSDITNTRAFDENIKNSERKWRSVLNSSNSGIFLLDSDLNITLINDYGRKMTQLLGNRPLIMNATNFLDLLPDARRNAVKKTLEDVLKGMRSEYEILYTKEDGSDLWLLVNYTPVKDVDGQISSICIVANNITYLKKKEAELLRSEQRWKFALDGAGDGVWEYNFQTNESYYSPLYKLMLGFSEDEFKNEANEWRARLHPDDLQRINDIDRQYEQEGLQNHAVEYRLLNKAGEYVWVLDRGMVLERSPDGKPLKVIGTHKNVTERKLAEKTLLQSQLRFSSFMANTPTMTWIIDENAVFRYLNEPYMESFQLSSDAIGKSIYEIFPQHICKHFIENNWKVWEQGEAIETVEEGVGPDGSQQFYHIFKFPLPPEEGVRMLGGVALDITKKIQIEQRLAAEEEKKKREIIQAIIDAQEKERKELAYELHDNVNQILTSSKLMLEVAAEKPALSAEFVERSLNYLNDAIVEIRKISHSLTPGTLRDISLEAAIDEVVQTINTTGKLQVTYERDIDPAQPEISSEIQISALRIVQEQLNNTLKHAGATEALVLLRVSPGLLSITVSDNGVGFDPTTTRKGLGLNNIFNRVEYFYGSIKLDSSPQKGCSLEIEIPLPSSTNTA